MGPEDIAFIKGAVGFVLLAATGLSAYWLRLRARAVAAREEQLLQSLRDEQAQVQAAMDARLAELEDRLDFAERRLLQSPPAQVPIEPPAISTPV